MGFYPDFANVDGSVLAYIPQQAPAPCQVLHGGVGDRNVAEVQALPTRGSQFSSTAGRTQPKRTGMQGKEGRRVRTGQLGGPDRPIRGAVPMAT